MRQIVCHATIAALVLMSACANAVNISAVDLGVAGTFAILSKAGITNVPTSAVSGGHVGSSPITGASIHLTCAQVTGTIYQVDAGGPACFVTDSTLLGTAISNMGTAITDASGRTNPNTTNLGAGEIGGLTVVPGVHKWTTSVLISTDVTLDGPAYAVWIFQISGDLNLANGKKVILSGGALSKNIFWQVGGNGITIGTGATMEGVLLSTTSITMNTGAVLNGRALAQTAISLQSSTVTTLVAATPVPATPVPATPAPPTPAPTPLPPGQTFAPPTPAPPTPAPGQTSAPTTPRPPTPAPTPLPPGQTHAPTTATPPTPAPTPLPPGQTYAPTTATPPTPVSDRFSGGSSSSESSSFAVPTPSVVKTTPVNLGTAAAFAILSKTGVTNVPTSAISGGHVGSSPITGAAILLTCPQVTGVIYQVDVGGPSCFVTDATLLGTAVLDMGIAYVDAAGRTNPNTTNLGSGELGGLTVVPGVHKWGTNVLISTDVTLAGSADSVWIFQISGILNLANGKKVILSGGALPKNIFWQVTGAVTIGSGATMQGNILASTAISMNTGAILNGRALAHTAVNLLSSTITAPQTSTTTTAAPLVIGGSSSSSSSTAAAAQNGSGALSTLAALLVAGATIIMGSTM